MNILKYAALKLIISITISITAFLFLGITSANALILQPVQAFSAGEIMVIEGKRLNETLRWNVFSQENLAFPRYGAINSFTSVPFPLPATWNNLPLEEGNWILVHAELINECSGGIPLQTCINAGGVIESASFSIIPKPLPVINSSTLTNGIVNKPYSRFIQVSGGTAPYSFSIFSGTLPGGLFLNNLTGEISGIPTIAGVFNFTVQVTDANNQTATGNISLTIESTHPLTLSPTQALSAGEIMVIDGQRLNETLRWNVFAQDNLAFPRYGAINSFISTPFSLPRTWNNLPLESGDWILVHAELINECSGGIPLQTCIDANGVIEQASFSIGNTFVGFDATVTPINEVTITFNQITKTGVTSVASSSFGPVPPSGFKLGNPPTYYTISTTAEFVPPVEICINYNETQIKNEKNLKLFHFENGQWVNVTVSLDTINNIICGQVSFFSEFALLEDVTIDHVIDEVKSFNLELDIEQGLLDKLVSAKSALERGKTKTAINILKSFTNQVKAQKDKKITNEQADILLTDVNEIVKVLGSGSIFFMIKLVLSNLWSRLFGLLLFVLK